MTMTVSDAVESVIEGASSARVPTSYRMLADDLNANVATAFMLHGAGTNDVVEGSLFYPEWLARKLARHLEVVVRFNPGSLDDEPLSFPMPGMRKQFELLVGLREPEGAAKPKQAGPDPFAMMRQAGGAKSEAGVMPLPTSTVEVVRLLMRFLRKAERISAAVIIERMDLIAPPSDKGVLPEGQKSLLGMLHAAGTDTVIESKGNPLIMFAPTIESVHADLRGASSGIRLIEVPLPDAEDRLSFVQFIHSYYDREAEKVKEPKVKMELTEQELASQTAGLYRRHIQDVWLRGAATENRTITRSLVTARKNEIMQGEYEDVLETMIPRFTFDDIGGNDIVKAWLMRHIVERMRTNNVRRLPKGLVFTGPAGTGKSLFAEALAAMLGINVVLLRPEKIKGGIYGESEQKVARALAGIRANVPCVVFIDEIDQRFRRGGGAGGAADAAEDNIFGRILEEIGDPGTRGKIIWIAATNRPDLCDAALFRPGRFDEKIPILPPDANDRPLLFRTLLKRHSDGQPLQSPPDFKWDEIVSKTDNWTGAEIEQAVISAYDYNELDKMPLPDAVLQAVTTLVPSTRDIERHTFLALKASNRKDLVPEKYRPMIYDEAAQEAAVAEIQKGDQLRTARRSGLE